LIDRRRASNNRLLVRPPRERKAHVSRPEVLVLLRPPPISPMPIMASTSRARAERQMARLLQFGHTDLYMYDHPELGGSLYDCHADGSGVCYSSRLRPISISRRNIIPGSAAMARAFTSIMPIRTL